MNRARTATVAASVAWVLAATWLQLMRGPGLRAYDVVWAEDGGVFLNQAMRHSLWHNLVTPHAGYLQVVAKLVAQPVAALPPQWAAAALATGAALVVALISLLVWFHSGHVLRSAWARVLVTAIVPLLPQAGFEVNAAVSDLHWYLAYAAFWVLLAPPRSVAGQVGSAAVVALAALSDPLTALVLPAAVVGIARAPRRLVAGIAPAVMVVALAVQGWVHLTRAAGYRASETVAGDLPSIYGLRVVLSALTGDRLLGPVYQAAGLVLVAVVGVVVALAVALLLWRADRVARQVAVVGLVCSVAYLAVPVGLRGTGGFLERAEFSLNGSRYTIVPLLLFWVAVAALLDRLRPRAVVGGAVAVFLGVQVLSDWAGSSVRTGGPSWRASVAEARAACATPVRPPQPVPLVAEEAGRYAVPIFPGPDDVTIVVAPVPPPGEPLLFAVVVPCTELRD
ncbi:glucosyltransferase [Amycolatopsis thermalba]|uniref:Glucosyltransferase n=1 Tax=Amycolatopsis thermalba TaxID=944492 RepID=A0ABY4NQV9_9PSEU|nr:MULTISPECIES: glucosyltransferase [Amycolatopsis]UQS22448.1 glucosyltransferase [Amycolatopsis thermalba]